MLSLSPMARDLAGSRPIKHDVIIAIRDTQWVRRATAQASCPSPLSNRAVLLELSLLLMLVAGSPRRGR